MQDQIKSIMAEILDINESSIGSDFGPEDTSSWDSLNNLKIITALEQEFNIQLTMSDIEKMVNFSVIAATIKKYLD